MDDIYYKIIGNEYASVVTMQWFDEYSYDKSRFFKDEYGDDLVFYDEDEAIQWLRDNVREEYIDPEYTDPKSSKGFDQSRYMK